MSYQSNITCLLLFNIRSFYMFYYLIFPDIHVLSNVVHIHPNIHVFSIVLVYYLCFYYTYPIPSTNVFHTAIHYPSILFIIIHISLSFIYFSKHTWHLVLLFLFIFIHIFYVNISNRIKLFNYVYRMRRYRSIILFIN